MSEKLNKEYLFSLLNISPRDVMVYEETDSTNTRLKTLAENGGKDGTWCMAEFQTGGRGRVGRNFFSPDGSGLYLSVLLRPNMSPVKANLLTTCAAVSATVAIEKAFGIVTDIKWVNDVYYNNKKIAGILTEGSVDMETGLLKYAVVGIGINVYKPYEGFPRDIENKAGYLIERAGCELGREKLAAEFIRDFMKRCENLEDDTIYTLYKERMFLSGKRVMVISHCGNAERPAEVVGVDRDFSLIVRYDDGEKANLTDGEVSIIL